MTHALVPGAAYVGMQGFVRAVGNTCFGVMLDGRRLEPWEIGMSAVENARGGEKLGRFCSDSIEPADMLSLAMDLSKYELI